MQESSIVGEAVYKLIDSVCIPQLGLTRSHKDFVAPILCQDLWKNKSLLCRCREQNAGHSCRDWRSASLFEENQRGRGERRVLEVWEIRIRGMLPSITALPALSTDKIDFNSQLVKEAYEVRKEDILLWGT
jgi:hypothetical protein